MAKIRKNDLNARKCYCEEYIELMNHIQARYETVKNMNDPDRLRAMERLIDLVIGLEDKGSYDKD